MSDVQRIAIVDPSDLTRDPFRNLLLGVESIWLEAECSRYEFFIDVIHQSMPDLAVVALDADRNKALQLIQQLALDFPTVPILAISAKGDGQLILQALRAGAKEFLTAPVVLEELLLAIQRLGAGRVVVADASKGGSVNHPVRTETQVISILGSRGGIGCTSIAVNLGCNLAQDKNLNVGLVDLDLALGDADVILDLVPDYTLADVSMNVDRLDMQFLRRSLCKHETGLSMLPHPVQLEDVSVIRDEHLSRLIGLLRASYSHLLFDLSKRFTPTDVTAMQLSDQILLVAQLDLSSIRNVVRILHTLNQDDSLAGKTRVIINRVGSADEEITLKKAEETIGQPIFWQVPNDFKNVSSARNTGVPLITYAPRSKAQLSLVGLANSIAGKDHQDVGTKEKKKSSFFSFR